MKFLAFILTFLLSQPLLAQERLSVLLILAHYDDETMISSILTRLQDQGATINAIYLTKGEGGSDVRGQITTKEDLIQQREKEMKKAAEILNIKKYHQVDAGDIPLRIPEEGYPNPAGRPTTSGRQFMESGIWDLEDIKLKLRNIVDDNNLAPDLIITLGNDSGVTHAHHQAANHLTQELLDEGAFGKQVKGVYGIVESQWYDVATMPYKSSALYFDVNSSRSKVRTQKHIEKAHEVYQAHVSQGVSKKTLDEISEFPEMLYPMKNPATQKDFGLSFMQEKLGFSRIKIFTTQKDWSGYHLVPEQWKLTCDRLLLDK